MQPGALADAIGVELIGRLAHGEGAGAYGVRLADGTHAVLKLYAFDPRDLATSDAIAGALRARGYPVPARLATGVVDTTGYRITELLPGEPLDQLGAAQLPAVSTHVAMQRDLGVPGREPWLEDLVTSVTDGRTGYCEHAAMAGHSNETRLLLDRLRRIADDARNAEVREQDAVHYDFSPYSILASGDTITGVVDWDGATAGDAAFDLVTLATYTYDVGLRGALLASAAATTEPRALALYAAHMVLRQVDWSLRHHDEGTVDWFIGVGTALLAAVGAR